MAFKSTVQNNQNNVHLTFEGAIDESSSLPDVGEVTGQVEIDLGKVEMINSIGCRNWVQWIRGKISAKGGVRLHRCSPAIVHQINILSGFLPKGVKVASFFVPYYCERCGSDDMVLMAHGTDFDDEKLLHELSDKNCSSCEGKMSADIIEKKFFQFINRRQ